MKLTTPLSSVYLFEFDTNEEMAETFCRIQEFYESPDFRGRHFTLEEFKEYHTKFFGEWDYYTRWGGFNIPGNVVKQFKVVFENDLSPKEAEVLKAIESSYHHTVGDKFYVIASVAGDMQTLNHELHHALFYLDENYRNRVYDTVTRQEHYKLTGWLLDNNYGRNVLIDEIAAYLMFEQNELLQRGFKESDLSPYVDTIYDLRLNYFKTKAKHEYYMFKNTTTEESCAQEG